ncbi:unnamed protein product [Blepharisma stoltei]|uniref:Uncharacterized protein n=1 Tax=Blepharisma stoltei TaxID=1481888 RepID=A0AAU9I8V7_9CILI|nr:unnamed protein product [Blepharisma stoltei]
MLSSPKTTDDTPEDYINSDISQSSSRVRSIDTSKSQEESYTYTVRRILPPIFTVKAEESEFQMEDEEIDPYEELNKQWKCLLQ